MSKRDQMMDAGGYVVPDAHATIRMDIRAAQAILAAGTRRALLVQALREHGAGEAGVAIRQEGEARAARVEQLSRALAAVTIELARLTTHMEAAAMLVLYASSIQRMNENKPKRGRPKKEGPTAEEEKVAEVIEIVRRHHPEASDAKITDDLSRMILEGKAKLGTPINAPELIPAVKKRVQRALKRVQSAKT